MISVETKNAYSEVFELIKFIDKNDLNRIPMDILISIKENRNEEYVPKIDFENINQSLSRDALALYIWLYKTYMAQDKNEIQEINKILYNNEAKNTINDVFKDENKKEIKAENTELIVYKENFIKRLVNKLKEIFKSV